MSLLPVFAVIAFSSPGDDWPGWRGPGASGVGSGSPPSTWSEDSNIRWKVAIEGKGLSCPVIWGDRVYVTTAIPTGEPAEESVEQADAAGGARTGQEQGGGRGGFGRGDGGGGGFGRAVPPAEHDFVVMALSRKDGSVVWQRTLNTLTPHEGTHGDGSFATPTLAMDGQRIVASFGSFGIFGLDMDGEVLWDVDLGDMSVQGAFGEGSSPVLAEEIVVHNWDHEGDSFIVAIDSADGSEMWRRERPRGTNWTTPLIVECDGDMQVIVPHARTVAYDLFSGDELWSIGSVPEEVSPRGQGGSGFGRGALSGGRRGGGGRNGVIASPVVADGILYLVTGGRSGGLHAVELASLSGDMGDDVEYLWSETRDLPSIPSPLLYQGVLYALKQNSGILSAFDASSGERLYGPERLEGVANAYASPVAADGRLYLTGRDGEIEVVAAGAEFQSLAVNQLDDSFDASPAIVGGELYLRGLNALYCIAEDD